MRVRDRIEAISALVLGGPLLRPRNDFAHGILASMLYALEKLPIFLMSARILVVILVAHDRKPIAARQAIYNGELSNFTGHGIFIPVFVSAPSTRIGFTSKS